MLPDNDQAEQLFQSGMITPSQYDEIIARNNMSMTPINQPVQTVAPIVEPVAPVINEPVSTPVPENFYNEPVVNKQPVNPLGEPIDPRIIVSDRIQPAPKLDFDFNPKVDMPTNMSIGEAMQEMDKPVNQDEVIVDRLYSALAKPETGRDTSLDDDARFIRTKAGADSSAYGPVQITKRTMEGFLKTEAGKNLSEDEYDYAKRFIDQGNKFLKSDYKDSKYGAGGVGDLTSEKDKALYESVAKKLISYEFKRLGSDPQKFAEAWRGVKTADDPKYFSEFNKANSDANAGGTSKEQKLNEQVTNNALSRLDKLENAYTAQQDAINRGAAEGKELAAKEASFLDNYKKEIEKQQVEAQQKESERKSALDVEGKKLQGMMDEYKDLKIDSNRFWKNKSTGEKILAALAVGLSAAGQSMQAQAGIKSSNLAMDVIFKSIDNDIQEQKDNINIKQNAISNQRSLISDMRQQFGDERQADAAARLISLQKVELELKKLAGQKQSIEVQTNLQLMSGRLEAEKQATLLKFDEAANQNIKKILLYKAVNEGAVDPNLLEKEDRERFVPGFGLAINKERAEKFSSLASETDTAKNGVKTLLKMADNSTSWSASDRAEAKALQQVLIGTLRSTILGPGAITDSERVIMEQVIANPLAVRSLSDSNKAVLNQLLTRLDVRLNAERKIAGLPMPKTADEGMIGQDLGGVRK